MHHCYYYHYQNYHFRYWLSTTCIGLILDIFHCSQQPSAYATTQTAYVPTGQAYAAAAPVAAAAARAPAQYPATYEPAYAYTAAAPAAAPRPVRLTYFVLAKWDLSNCYMCIHQFCLKNRVAFLKVVIALLQCSKVSISSVLWNCCLMCVL